MHSLQTAAEAELEAARADLMMQLPAEPPAKDDWNQGGPQPDMGAAPADVAAPMTEDELIDSLMGLPWHFVVTKDARQEWQGMDRPYRSDLHHWPRACSGTALSAQWHANSDMHVSNISVFPSR